MARMKSEACVQHQMCLFHSPSIAICWPHTQGIKEESREDTNKNAAKEEGQTERSHTKMKKSKRWNKTTFVSTFRIRQLKDTVYTYV